MTQRLGGNATTVAPLPTTLKGIWRAFLAEPWSFKWTCVYVFFEYVRPQQVYESLQILPWALLSILAAVVCFLLEGRPVRSRTLANGLLLALALVVVLSSVFAYSPHEAFDKIDVIVNWLLAFFLIANTATDQRKFFLFMVLYLLWSTKMSQFAARSFLTGGGAAGGAPGWFQNTGEFALQMCIFVPLALQFLIGLGPMLSRRKKLLLMLLPLSGMIGVINSGSRGGVLGFACVVLWMLFQSKYKVRGFATLAVMLPLFWILLPQTQKDRFRTAGQDETSRARLAYWRAGVDMLNTHPFLGVGYNNWAPYYREHYLASEDEDLIRWAAPGEAVIEASHNSFVEVMSQLGYPGLFLFSGLLIATWILNFRTRRILRKLGERGRFLREMSHGLDAGVVGFIVAGFFMAVAFNPFVWFQLGMTAALNVAAIRLAAADSGETSFVRVEGPDRLPGWRSRRLSGSGPRFRAS